MSDSEIWVRLRWPDGVVWCPRCGHADPYKAVTRPVWICRNPTCKHHFSATAGTAPSNSRLTPSEVLAVVGDWLSGKSGLQIARERGHNQKGLWVLTNKIREVLAAAPRALTAEDVVAAMLKAGPTSHVGYFQRDPQKCRTPREGGSRNASE